MSGTSVQLYVLCAESSAEEGLDVQDVQGTGTSMSAEFGLDR